jgi:hypothetical protein
MARTLRSDLETLTERAKEAAQIAGETCADTVASQPYAVTAAALGVGFVLGGGVSRGATTLLLGTVLRSASALLGRRLLEEMAHYAEMNADEYGSEDGGDAPARASHPRAAPPSESDRNPQ